MKNKHRRPDYAELYPGVEISDEILSYFKKNDRKIEYWEHDRTRDRYKRDKNGELVKDKNGLTVTMPSLEISLNLLIEKDWQFGTDDAGLESVMGTSQKLEIEELYRCIRLLDEYEQMLIRERFVNRLTQEKLADKLGKSQQTVSRHIGIAIAKIKKMWNY